MECLIKLPAQIWLCRNTQVAQAAYIYPDCVTLAQPFLMQPSCDGKLNSKNAINEGLWKIRGPATLIFKELYTHTPQHDSHICAFDLADHFVLKGIQHFEENWSICPLKVQYVVFGRDKNEPATIM